MIADDPTPGAGYPAATLFAFQILLGVVFGIWGLAPALPIMAIAKVMIDHIKTEGAVPQTTVAA
jgi:predicted PurR-regulated permease PerM